MWIYKLLLIGLISTLAIELMVAILFKTSKTDLYIIALANILTNPVIVLLYHLFCTVIFSEILLIAVLEISAITIEWLIYKSKTSIKYPAIFALSANAVSFGMGLLVF